VDESGNQLAVFGRRGARPFNLEELRRMYLMDGKLYTVTDNPATPANDFKGGVGAAKPGSEQPEAKPATPVSTGGSVSSHTSIFSLRRLNASTKLAGGGLGLLLVGLGLHRLRRLRRNT
jgi:hypothetical protein